MMYNTGRPIYAKLQFIQKLLSCHSPWSESNTNILIYTRGLFNYLWNKNGIIRQNKKFDTTVREDVDGFVMEISKALDAAAR